LNPKWIVGKTVSAVELNRFGDGKGTVAHNPHIWFTDGSSIAFNTEETEIGEYGTTIVYRKPKRREVA
jgi:hypothetical protein